MGIPLMDYGQKCAMEEAKIYVAQKNLRRSVKLIRCIKNVVTASLVAVLLITLAIVFMVTL